LVLRAHGEFIAAAVPMAMCGLAAGLIQPRTASSSPARSATQPAVTPDVVSSCRKIPEEFCGGFGVMPHGRQPVG